MDMGKKKCELCGGIARMYCESDQASLCWNCDVKVHAANFLVAKHTRCLLCSACQSPTPWKASGLRLGPTVSICESCLARKNNSVASTNQNLVGCDGDRLRREDDGAESYKDDEDDEGSDEDEDEDEDEEEEEEAENQVVPAAAQQLPVVSSSSFVSSGFTGDGDLVVKRTRRNLDLNCSDEEIGDSSESRPLKRSSRSTAMMNSMLRLHGGRKIRRL